MRPRTGGGWYELGIGAALTAMVLYAVGASGIPEILAGAQARGHSPGWVAVSLLCFVGSAWIAGWYFAGPLAVSAARLHWLVPRQDPAAMVRRATVQVVLGSAALATVVAVVTGLALDAVGLPAVVPALAVWLVLELLVLAAIRVQRRDLDAVARTTAFASSLAGVTVAAGEAWGRGALTAIGVVAAGTLTAAIAVAARRGTSRDGTVRRWRGVTAELTPRWQLRRGARHRWAVSAGVTLLEGDVVRIVRQRDNTALGRPLPAAVYRAPAPLNLSAVVLLRSARSIAAIASVAVPLAFAAHEILGSTPSFVVIALAQFALVISTARAAESWLTSDALPRIWAADGPGPAAALAVPCVLAGLGLAAIAVAGFPLPPAAGVALAALPVAILWRRRSARRPDTGLTLVSTPMGAVSVQSVNKVVAGPDAVLLAILFANGVG